MGINNRKRRKEKKRKKLLKRKRASSKKQPSQSFVVLPNLFENRDIQSRKQFISILNKSSKSDYKSNLEKIKETLSQYDPFTLIAMLSFYGLSTFAGNSGIKRKDKQGGLQQVDVEISQAILLTLTDFKEMIPPTPEVFQDFQETLINFRKSFYFSRFDANFFDKDLKQKTILQIQEELRMHTHTVRNWGHYSQVKRISLELYGYFDDLMFQNYGYSATNVIEFFDFILSEVEKRLTERFIFLKKLRASKTIEDMVDLYYQTTKTKDSDEMKVFFRQNNFKLDEVFLMLLAHFDLFLQDVYMFDIKETAKVLDINQKSFACLIKRFSYKLGDLSDKNIDYFNLDNPIWYRPLILIDEYTFFCPIPPVFFGFVFQNMDSLISDIDKDLLSKRRSLFLENKIEEIVKTRFPESNVLKNFEWYDGNTKYETDILIFIDSCIIIVEAKSGKIDPSSLRGAPKKLQRDINRLLIEPNLQSERLKNKLLYLINNPEIADPIREKLPIDLKNIYKILRTSVTLEYFANIQSNVKKLQDTDWIPENISYCPTMSLADFEKVFDILEEPVEIIYYLERRETVESTIDYIGNEIDLLGYYINQHLIFPQNDHFYILAYMSEKIDNYYDSMDSDVILEKPKVKMTKLFQSIIEQLKKRKKHRWIEMGTILYSFPPDAQKQISSKIIEIKKNVKKHWMKKGHKNILLFIPPSNSEYAFCYFAYNNQNKEKRYDYAKWAAEEAFENEHINYCLVIGKNIESSNVYDLIVLYEPSA